MNSEKYNNSIENVETKKIGMRWYKYITYFLYPFNAVFSIFVSIIFMPGVVSRIIDTISDLETKFFLRDLFEFFYYKNVWIANLIYAVIFIGIALYNIYISVSLHKFKKSAPKHIIIEMIISSLLSTIYLVSVYVIVKDFLEIDAEAVASLIRNFVENICSMVIWVLIYDKYFNNRKHLFIN